APAQGNHRHRRDRAPVPAPRADDQGPRRTGPAERGHPPEAEQHPADGPPGPATHPRLRGPPDQLSHGVSMTAARTCRLVTLGCKVNQYETQQIKEALEASGYREAEDGEPAELCIVNTCTVTGEADA